MKFFNLLSDKLIMFFLFLNISFSISNKLENKISQQSKNTTLIEDIYQNSNKISLVFDEESNTFKKENHNLLKEKPVNIKEEENLKEKDFISNKKSENKISFQKNISKIGKIGEKKKIHNKDYSSNMQEKDLNMNEIKKKITERNIKDQILFEEFIKKKNQRKKKYGEDDNVFMFYNSLSLIMLSMLGGGVVGVIFILYFSFKDDNSIYTN